jgi:hypothetical protein
MLGPSANKTLNSNNRTWKKKEKKDPRELRHRGLEDSRKQSNSLLDVMLHCVECKVPGQASVREYISVILRCMICMHGGIGVSVLAHTYYTRYKCNDSSGGSV